MKPPPHRVSAHQSSQVAKLLFLNEVLLAPGREARDLVAAKRKDMDAVLIAIRSRKLKHSKIHGAFIVSGRKITIPPPTKTNHSCPAIARTRSAAIRNIAPTANSIRQLPPEMLFDALAIRVDGPRAWDEKLTIDIRFTDTDEFHRLRLANGVLTHRSVERGAAAELTVSCPHGALPALALGQLRADDLEPMPELADPDDPSRLLSCREERECLWEKVRLLLPQIQYHALWLRYAEDLSVAGIARVLGKTQTHIKVLLFRARSSLARELRAKVHTRVAADVSRRQLTSAPNAPTELGCYTLPVNRAECDIEFPSAVAGIGPGLGKKGLE